MEIENVESSLTVEDALKQVRSESVFSGHPATSESEESEVVTKDEPIEKDVDDSGDDKPEKTQETDEKEEPQKDAEDERPVKKKYASHEEAEKGAKEAERRMHEAIEEARKIRTEVDEIKEQISTASKSETITKQEKKELDVYFKDMLSKIKQLDPEDPGYDEQLAKEWAGSIKSSVGVLLSEENERRSAERAQEDAVRKANEEVGKKIVEMATDAGLDMSSEKSPDYDLFWAMSQSSVGKTVDERINWTITKVNTIKSGIVGKTKESIDKSKKAQMKNKVLERGVSPSSVAKEVETSEPLTVMDAFEKVRRRI
jgi:hypothetical protein